MDYKKKKCIFHVPNYIEPSGKSGSSLRPIKMLTAFKNIGYDVDIVMGYGEDRKKQIEKIKNNINNGLKYDFMYSESSTMPTLLTEKNHLPKYPFLDFSFFSFCKKHGIKIGLFYRDIHWRFPHYRNNVSFLKKLATIPMYYYDLIQYRKYIDILYLVGGKVVPHIPIKNVAKKIEYLPPGCNNDNTIKDEQMQQSNKCQNTELLKLFYVGGIGDLYRLEKLLKVVSEKSNVKLTLCCREKEWEDNKSKFSKYLKGNIEIIHKFGNELAEYYIDSDVASLFLEPIEYMSIAMPIKLFEYIGYYIPIIATEGTEAGDFVKNNNVGWTILYEEEKLSELLDYIYINKGLILEKKNNLKTTFYNNKWENRALKVAADLS